LAQYFIVANYVQSKFQSGIKAVVMMTSTGTSAEALTVTLGKQPLSYLCFFGAYEQKKFD